MLTFNNFTDYKLFSDTNNTNFNAYTSKLLYQPHKTIKLYKITNITIQ